MPGLCRPVIESGRIAVGGLGGTAAIRIALWVTWSLCCVSGTEEQLMTARNILVWN
jgi:hypothetical protein